MKLTYTKGEVENIKNQVYFSEIEEKVLDMWLRDCTLAETSMKLNISTARVSEHRKRIITKINRLKIQ